MSTTRDLMWFSKSWTTVAAGSQVAFSVPINATNHLSGGDIPLSAVHNELKGTIESVNIRYEHATGLPLDVVFYRSSNLGNTVLSSDNYLGHESFAAADVFEIGGEIPQIQRGSVDRMGVHYHDDDRTQKFHIALLNTSATALSTAIRVDWAWRPDTGGN